MVLSLIPRTLEALRTHFLAHYPAPDATQANAHCDPFGLLLKTRVLSQRLLVTKRRDSDWFDSKEQGLGSRPGQRYKSKVPKGLSEAR